MMIIRGRASEGNKVLRGFHVGKSYILIGYSKENNLRGMERAKADISSTRRQIELNFESSRDNQ